MMPVQSPKKRALLIAVTLLVLLATLTPGSLQPGFAALNLRVVVNGETIFPDVQPVISEGRLLLPFRTIGEALGATVAWEESTHTLTASHGGRAVAVTVGASWAVVDGTVVALDTPLRITDGRSLAPVRFLCESLGANVDWDESSYIVHINSGAGAETVTGITINGSEVFREKVNNALQLLEDRAPGHYNSVNLYLRRITAGDHSGVDVYTRNFYIGANTVTTADQYWLAGIIVHDAHHSYLYAAGMQFSGEAAEAACILRQKDALRQIGAPEHYQEHLDSVLATRYWEVPYTSRNW